MTEEFHPNSTTPGLGNSSNSLMLLNTCSLRITLIHNGYLRERLQKKVKKSTPCPYFCCIWTVRLTKVLKNLFHSVFYPVSHYQSQAFRCHKNPYLSLFNLYCVSCLLKASLAAIDLVEQRASPRGLEPPVSTPGFEMIKRAVRWARGKRAGDVTDAVVHI